jgi:hypothetical protein
MEPEQRKMSTKFNDFISSIRDIDYQIAMTTTDLDSKHALKGRIVTWEGTSTKLLTPKTPNAEKAFLQTIQRNETIECNRKGAVCPSSNEQPLRATKMAIDLRNTDNRGLFRSDVDTVVIVLSDEDEMSTGGSNATTPDQVLSHFEAAFGKQKRFVAHGIIIKPGDQACLKEQKNGAYGTKVAELAQKTGGTIGSICEPEYGSQLTAISEQVRKLVGTFVLNQEPLPGSVRVRLTPNGDARFRVEGKKVIFSTPPAAGTRVEIEYSYK